MGFSFDFEIVRMPVGTAGSARKFYQYLFKHLCIHALIGYVPTLLARAERNRPRRLDAGLLTAALSCMICHLILFYHRSG
jgi:hypothetical protein